MSLKCSSWLCSSFAFILSTTSILADAKNVRICQTKPAVTYRIEVANLLLSLTSTSNNPHDQLEAISEQDPTQARCITLLQRNKVDLIYLGATTELLEKFRVVKQDIHHGMLGYRVLIIRSADSERFAGVDTLDKLREFTGGFGSQWGDFKMFTLNKLPVVGTATPTSLLAMLNAHRFDYYHRGLHEAWKETDNSKELMPQLIVEPNIALVYDYPVYFMVAKNNLVLAARLEKGFAIAGKSGALDRLFKKRYGALVAKANLSRRKLIRIKYPTPAGLPKVDTSLWFE